MTTAKNLITQLSLAPHVEGGYFKRAYVSDIEITLNQQKRAISSASYYLLEAGDFSCWHRLKSDEMWHYYCGSGLVIYEITQNGDLRETVVGNPIKDATAVPQYLVPANTWFAAAPQEKTPTSFTLVGLTVFPAFDFADFEMAEREQLCKAHPKHSAIIHRFTRRP